MARISEEEITNIRNSANIVDIISGYVPLNKSGSDYVGICPFHEDHSPSMHVSTRLGIFKCFVCNTGGNVFSFVQKFENVSYPEAIKIVAEKSGIAFNHQIDREPIKKFKEEYEIMDLSLKYYQNNINTLNGEKAKEYLKSRGINENIIKEFKIGVSFDNNKLTSFFESKKIDLEKGYNIGLLNKNGIDYYDMFSDRIMIPIIDNNGNVCGYTARCYLKDEKNKYINSKESIIYHKSDVLFNYFNAKNEIKLNKEIVIVEGNMDAITLASHGIKNVCALMGVVISKSQIELLKRLNSKIVLMLDNDDAGKLATLKLGDELLNSGLDLYVVRLSGAKDPDEYLRKFGKDKLLDNIKHARKYIDFKIDSLKENKDLSDITELTSYIKDVLSVINNVSTLEKDIIISKICNEYHIDPDVIYKSITPEKKEIKQYQQPSIKKSKYHLAVQSLLRAMLSNKDFYDIYMDNLGYLEEKVERDTAMLIGSYIKKNNNIDISGFIDYVNTHDEIAKYVEELLVTDAPSDMEKTDFVKLLNIVSKCIDENEIKRLKENIKNEQDVAKKIELIEKLTELKKGCGNNEGN